MIEGGSVWGFDPLWYDPNEVGFSINMIKDPDILIIIWNLSATYI